MSTVVTLLITAALLVTKSTSDVLQSLTCDFSLRTACQFALSDNLIFGCDDPATLCYVQTSPYFAQGGTVTSATFNNSQPVCFTIAYKLIPIGSIVGVTVSVSGHTILNQSTDTWQYDWQQASATIPVGDCQQVVIEATKQLSYDNILLLGLTARYGAC